MNKNKINGILKDFSILLMLIFLFNILLRKTELFNFFTSFFPGDYSFTKIG